MTYLYAMDITKLEANLASYRGIVPLSRLDQLSLRPVRERMLGLAAELLFQRAVRRHCPGVPLPVGRDKGKHGKPYLLGCPDFHFNLSHSGIWAACAVADAPVGVDIQQERPVPARLSRQFSPAEQRELDALVGEEQTRKLFDLWVMKEAFTKCTGEGLSHSFRSFEGAHPAPGYSTQLVDFPAGDYHVALCTQTDEPDPVQILIMPA